MRNSILLCLATFVSVAFTSRAEAYDNDGHAILCYWEARIAGFTPEQAYRIASANVMVDYSPQVEPLQGKSPSRNAQEPRMYFHAFLDFLSKNPEADKAAQLAALRLQGLALGNPGGYLHAYMDSFSHKFYYAVLGHGHWGHTPDYLSFAPTNWTTRNSEMANGMYSELTDFINVSQSGGPFALQPRPDSSGYVTSALDALVQANSVSGWSSPDMFEAYYAFQAGYPYSAFGLAPQDSNLYFLVLDPEASSKFNYTRAANLLSPSDLDAFTVWSDLDFSLTFIPNWAGIDWAPDDLTLEYMDLPDGYGFDTLGTTTFGGGSMTIRVPVGPIAISFGNDYEFKVGNAAKRHESFEAQFSYTDFITAVQYSDDQGSMDASVGADLFATSPNASIDFAASDAKSTFTIRAQQTDCSEESISKDGSLTVRFPGSYSGTVGGEGSYYGTADCTLTLTNNGSSWESQFSADVTDNLNKTFAVGFSQSSIPVDVPITGVIDEISPQVNSLGAVTFPLFSSSAVPQPPLKPRGARALLKALKKGWRPPRAHQRLGKLPPALQRALTPLSTKPSVRSH